MVFLAGRQAIRYNALMMIPFSRIHFQGRCGESTLNAGSTWASTPFLISLIAKGRGRAQSLTVEGVGGVIR